jgi:hypothetical protein
MNPSRAIIRGKSIGKKRFQSNSTIPRSREWMMVNYVVNATKNYLLGFYIFKGGWIRDNYIRLCKVAECMIMQTKAWTTSFFFKEFFFIFQEVGSW